MNREFCVAEPARYDVAGLDEVDTPRLLFYKWALDANRGRLAEACDGLDNVRLMFKTCKATSILRDYHAAGMTAAKASCVAEARAMAGGSPLTDILVAFPCYGPTADSFLALSREFPDRRFSVTVPNRRCAAELSERAEREVAVYLDIDPGMGRMGRPFGRPALDLADEIRSLPSLRLSGLHIYDGHVHETNPHAILRHSERLMRRIDETVRALGPDAGIEEVVTSSSITFRSNAAAYRAAGYRWRHRVSPGTVVLWDSNYNDLMPGAFDYAAAVATRVVDIHEQGGRRLITTDCGAKMGASVDVGRPHVLNVAGYRSAAVYERFGMLQWLAFDRATREPLAGDPADLLGQVILAFPRHVCPTVNQYDFALLVRDGAFAGEVAIDARDG
jgi:D-serine deaminase-like pyridoxal phosphate-dependent protein